MSDIHETLSSRSMRSLLKRFYVGNLSAFCLVFIMLLAGCGNAGGGGLPEDFGGKHRPAEYGDQAREGYEFEEIMGWSSGSEPVYALPEQESYGPNSKLSMVLLNTGEEELFYGVDYRIERKTGKSWSKVPFGQTVGIDSLGISLPPGGIWRQKVQLEDFSPGTYRYIKNVEYVKSGKKKEVYGEFIVTLDGE